MDNLSAQQMIHFLLHGVQAKTQPMIFLELEERPNSLKNKLKLKFSKNSKKRKKCKSWFANAASSIPQVEMPLLKKIWRKMLLVKK